MLILVHSCFKFVLLKQVQHWFLKLQSEWQKNNMNVQMPSLCIYVCSCDHYTTASSCVHLPVTP